MSQRYTNVRLLSGVPFDNTYAHTRWFKTVEEQRAYFNNFRTIKAGVNYSYQRENETFRVDSSKDSLLSVNYMMYQNPDDTSHWFYAFVTDLEYKNENVTFVHFEVDVLQTWRFYIGVRESYVVRQHSKRLNGTTPIVNTIDEQLNYGTEYDLVFGSNFHPTGVNFLVIMTSEPLPMGDIETETGGSIVGAPSSFSYYLLPVSQNGEVYDMVLDESNGEQSALGSFRDYMGVISSKEPFLNRIVGMYMTSYCGIDFTVDHSNKVVRFINTDNITLARIDYAMEIDGERKRYTMYNVRKVTAFQSKVISITDDVYADFKRHYNAFESKTYMFPYCLIEIADMKGNILTLKPEYLKNADLKIRVFGSLGTSNKVLYTPVGYNTSVDGTEKMLSDFSVIDTDPTDISVITEYAAAMMQGQKNSLMAQQQNIMNTANHGAGNTAMSTAGAIFSGFASVNPFVTLTNLMGAGQQINNVITEKENGLNSLSAKVQDIQNVPPTVQKMGANTAFTLGNFSNNVYVRWKMIKPEYASRLDKHFKVYGTKTLDITTPNLQTRKHWNFIKLQEANIVGTFGAKYISRVKEIFNAGITLWHDDDVLNYNRDNVEV